MTVAKPQGAFYFYISVAGWIGKTTDKGKTLENDDDVAQFLLEDYLLAIVSGKGFGLSPYIRLSYSASDQEVDAGIEALRRASLELHS